MTDPITLLLTRRIDALASRLEAIERKTNVAVVGVAGTRRHHVSFWLDVPAHVSPLGVEDAVRALVEESVRECGERPEGERLFLDAGDFEVEGAEPRKGYDAGYSAGYDAGYAEGYEDAAKDSLADSLAAEGREDATKPSADGHIYTYLAAVDEHGRLDPAAEPNGSRRETQASISSWAEATFGPVGANVRVAARANEEMAELLRVLATDDKSPMAAIEIADVVIVLYRLAARLGVDLHDAIDVKMAVNRSREWKLDGTGHGYHVKGAP